MSIRNSVLTRRALMIKLKRNIRISNNNNSHKQTVYNKNSLMIDRALERKAIAVISIKYPLHRKRIHHKTRA
jgi:hypothetical protein